MFMTLPTTKRALVWVLFALGLIFTASCSADQSNQESPRSPVQADKLALFNETAGQMYQYMQQGDPAEARNKLYALADQITQIQFDGITSLEGVHALTELFIEGKAIFNTAQFQHHEGKLITSQIRLAIDALLHNNEPMWRQHDQPILETLQKLEAYIQNQATDEARKTFQQLHLQYKTLRPAIMVARQPEEVERIDSLFKFMNHYIMNGSLASRGEQLLKGVDELRRSFAAIFGGDDITTFLPIIPSVQPRLWATSIALSIISVLAYVAWKMFGTDKTFIFINRRRE